MTRVANSLHALTLKASTWTLLGFGLSQIFRFIGHLVLARYLIPADFGVMQLVNVFVQGLHMVSDVGLGSNIMQHKKGEDPSFLSTTWSIQIVRGGLLWLLTFLIAYPVSYIYEAPDILWLLPIAGLAIFIDGLASTNLFVINRRMEMNKLAAIDIFSAGAGVLAMVLCAIEWQSVWTLLVSPIVSGIVKTSMSHFVIKGPKLHFQWNKEDGMEIIHFGKWIFLSTLTTFMVSRLDRIILGLYLTIGDLGLYGIASALVQMVIDTAQMLTGRVLTPIYVKIKKETPEIFRGQLLRVRIFILALTLPILILLVIFGQQIVDLLYPVNYHQTGWMVRLIAAGSVMKVINATMIPMFIAMGDSYRLMIVQVIQSVLMIILMLIGSKFYGIIGLIGGILLSDFLIYPLMAYSLRQYNAWQPVLDFGVLASFYGIILLSLFF